MPKMVSYHIKEARSDRFMLEYNAENQLQVPVIRFPCFNIKWITLVMCFLFVKK